MAVFGDTNADAIVAAFVELEFKLQNEIGIFLFRNQVFGSFLTNQNAVFDDIHFGVTNPSSQVFAIEEVRPTFNRIDSSHRFSAFDFARVCLFRFFILSMSCSDKSRKGKQGDGCVK